MTRVLEMLTIKHVIAMLTECEPYNRQIIQFEFLLTWSCVSLTRSTTASELKFSQIWPNGGQLFLNIADWCHILFLTCLKHGT